MQSLTLLRYTSHVRLVAIALVVSFGLSLLGCGGGGSTLGSSSTGGGLPLSPPSDSSSRQAATARLEVDLETNTVKVIPITSDSRAVFGPGSVSVTSAEVFSQTTSLSSTRVLRLSLKNNLRVPIGIKTPVGFQISTAFRQPSAGTIAGIGAGSTSDGSAASAAVGSPIGVWEDNAGSVFITQGVQGAVRVLRDGAVTTLSSNFSSPAGITGEPSGDFIFFIEQGSHRIIRLRKDGREGSVLAGAGVAGDVDGAGASARFSSPIGLASDPTTGVLYVADFANAKIKTVTNWRNGPVQVGTLASGISQPIGVGFGTIDGRPVVVTASSNTGQVFLIDPTTGTRALIRTLSPSITGVTIRENRVIVARSNSTLTSLASGNGGNPFQASSWTQEWVIGDAGAGFADGLAPRFNAPYLLSSGTGRVLLADTSNHRIRELILPNFIGGFSTQGVIFSNANRINRNFTADYIVGRMEPGAVRTVDATFTVRFAAAMTFYVTVFGDIDGVIPVDGGSQSTVFVRNLAGSAGSSTSRDGVGADASVFPTWMSATDTDYVFFTEGSRIRVLNPTGRVTTITGFGSGSQANGSGESFAPGNVLRSISVSRDGRLLAFSTESAVFMGRLTGSNIENPSDWQFARIAGDAINMGNTLGDGNTARLQTPYVYLDGQDRVYLADAANHAIRQVVYRGGFWTNAANWTVLNVAGPTNGATGFVNGTGVDARFNGPLVITPFFGEFLILDSNNAALRRLTGLAVSTFFPPLPADSYFNLAVDDTGRIYLRSLEGISTFVNGERQMILSSAVAPDNEGSNVSSGTGVAFTVNRATGRLFFFRSSDFSILSIDQVVP